MDWGGTLRAACRPPRLCGPDRRQRAQPSASAQHDAITHENEAAGRRRSGFDKRSALFNRRDRQNLVHLNGLEPDTRACGGATEGADPIVLLGFLTARHHRDQVSVDSSAVKMQSKAIPAK